MQLFINTIKANAKCECIFKQFCKDQNTGYVGLLLQTDVRWLAKGNFLTIFMELFDILSEFVDDKAYMTLTDS